MNSNTEIMEVLTNQGEAFEAFTKSQDERITQIKGRVEEIEASLSDPRYGQATARIERLNADHTNIFVNEFLRKGGGDSSTKQKLENIEQAIRDQQQREGKSVTIGTPSAGGYAVPEEIAREIERQELLFSPVRRIVKIQRVGSNDNKHLVNLRGATSGWTGETGTRSETDTPTFRERSPTMGELYAYPKATEWALDDAFFDLGQWLAEEVAQEFAQEEGAAVLSGNGSNKPTGMVNTTPTVDDDFSSPLRDPSAYQYVACANSDSPSTAAISADCLISLVYKVNSIYRANSRWTMNSSTASAVRQLKDEQGQYLWQRSLAEGQPDLLLGHPVEFWEDMDDIGANNFPIAFGDFRRGYLLVDRTDLRITADEVTQPGYVKFYVRRREGGCVLNNDAVKFLRTTTS